MRNQLLTGGGFLRGNQCGKSLYLYLKYPELEGKRHNNQKDAHLKRKIAATLTKHLFPKGKFSGINGTGSFDVACALTRKLIKDKTNAIYNACFLCEGVYVVIDVLHYNNGFWKAYTLWHNDEPFDNIILSGSLQKYVTKKCDFEIDDFFAIEYRTKTDEDKRINLDYKITSIREHVSHMQDFTGKRIHDFRILLDSGHIPDVQTGEHCIRPHPCEYHDFCKYSKESD
jgi:hypothetical protein